MDAHSKIHWGIGIISLFVFILTFFIFFRETQELLSSLTAALLSTLLVLASLIIVSWFIRVFTK